MQEKKEKISVYFIVPASTGISPSQRFRFEQYLILLKEQGIRYRVSGFYTENGWKTIFTRGNYVKKAFIVLRGVGKRFIDLFRLAPFRLIYIHREALPLGPPFFEWFMSRVLRKKIIYDFDDSIWIPAISKYNKRAIYFKNFGKVAKICRWSFKVSVGNRYLAEYASRFNRNVYIVPTVVDTEAVHNKMQVHQTQHPAIGWTGTFSTLPYLDIVMPVLKELQETNDFDLVVIAETDPILPLKNYTFVKWKRETEAEDLLRFHIGLMPLYDDAISQGKCGFKAIQYMSLGIPAIVSPVGVNSEIVDNQVNGFVSDSNTDWKENLLFLLKNAEVRQKMGMSARKKIEDSYSVKSSFPLFLGLLSKDQDPAKKYS
ncbi:MAG: glycosyltransferase [Chitinophagaceae bacterium]